MKSDLMVGFFQPFDSSTNQASKKRSYTILASI